MRIPAEIDETQIEDICKYADDYFDLLREKRHRSSALICSLKGRINEKLQEKNEAAYESIIAITRSAEFFEARGYDIELDIFNIAASIYQIERGTVQSIFDGLEYVEDFLSTYDGICGRLRRIQLGLPEEQCKEIIDYSAERKLSVFAVSQILLSSGVGNKPYVGMKLASYYRENGLIKEALYVLNVIEESSDDENKAKIEAIKNSYLENA